jgi:serine/threonine protein phosphatase 1
MPRLLAIGDIHGCSTALDALLALVAPTPQDQIVTLGDYVDRGPDTCGVVDRLIELHSSHQIVSLRGNHEIMMLQARRGGQPMAFWMAVGGQEALASYSPTGRLSEVPKSHWDFIQETCVDWHETEGHFFVHGSVQQDLPLDKQPSSKLHWENVNELTRAHESGKIMVCGHTEQADGWPLVTDNVVCIDTRCYGGGWLTCLDALSGRLWQANQLGQTRTGWIHEPQPDSTAVT